MPTVPYHGFQPMQYSCESAMAVPFGFSVGDFIAVGQLIQKITVELREVCSCLHCSTVQSLHESC